MGPDEWWPGEFGDLSPFTLEKTDFSAVTDEPVRCYPVTRGGELFGYLWGAETADAADFWPLPGLGAAGYDARGVWGGRLRRLRDAGFTAAEAVAWWVGEPEHPVCGRVGAEARSLPGTRAVWALARE